MSKYKLKILFLSGLGGFIEFYDFIIFAVFAPVITDTFFPLDSKLYGLLKTFAIFAAGYLARPIGGLIFAHFGDLYGRKRIFIITLLMMGISTVLMAITPSYQTLGLLSPTIFSLLRIVQGFSLGGEIPGGLTYVLETFYNSPGLGWGVFFCLINLGAVFGMLFNSVMNNMGIYLDIGWRIAFFIGGLFAIGSYFVRKNFQETTVFLKTAKKERARLPIFYVLNKYKRESLSVFCIAGAHAGIGSIAFVYMIAYLQKILNYGIELSGNLTLMAVLVFCCVLLLVSILADYLLNHKIVLLSGFVLISVLSPIIFNAFIDHYYIWVYSILLGATYGLIGGSFPIVITKLFPCNIRFSGVAFGYNLGFAVFIGLSPMITTFILAKTGNLFAPSWVIVACAILGIAGVFLTKNRDKSK